MWMSKCRGIIYEYGKLDSNWSWGGILLQQFEFAILKWPFWSPNAQKYLKENTRTSILGEYFWSSMTWLPYLLVAGHDTYPTRLQRVPLC